MKQLAFHLTTYRTQKPSQAVLFFISSFKTKVWFYYPFLRSLVKMGFTVYAYDYRSRPLLHVAPGRWPEFSQTITDDIQRHVAFEKEKNHVTSFGIVGISVGTILAIHAAKKVEAIKRVMLINPYGSNAIQAWHHRGLRQMKQEYFVSKGLSLEDAQKVFGEVEPITNVELLTGKPVLVFANRRDHVINYSNTKLFIDTLQAYGIACSVRTMNLPRHSMSNIRALQLKGVWYDFLLPLQPTKSTRSSTNL